MKKEKSNGIMVGVLIGLVIAAVVVGCLFVTNMISFSSKENVNTTLDDNSDGDTVLTYEEALLKVKEVYKKFNNFDSISIPFQFCGDSDMSNPNDEASWYVKSKQFKSKEEAYNYYNTFVSRELIDKKVSELDANIIKSDKFPAAILEKDGALYCWCIATGGFNNEIIDDKTTYEIKEVTSNKITFTGTIIKYMGYDIDVSEPYNIEATLELINNNWIVTKNTIID